MVLLTWDGSDLPLPRLRFHHRTALLRLPYYSCLPGTHCHCILPTHYHLLRFALQLHVQDLHFSFPRLHWFTTCTFPSLPAAVLVVALPFFSWVGSGLQFLFSGVGLLTRVRCIVWLQVPHVPAALLRVFLYLLPLPSCSRWLHTCTAYHTYRGSRRTRSAALFCACWFTTTTCRCPFSVGYYHLPTAAHCLLFPARLRTAVGSPAFCLPGAACRLPLPRACLPGFPACMRLHAHFTTTCTGHARFRAGLHFLLGSCAPRSRRICLHCTCSALDPPGWFASSHLPAHHLPLPFLQFSTTTCLHTAPPHLPGVGAAALATGLHLPLPHCYSWRSCLPATTPCCHPYCCAHLYPALRRACYTTCLAALHLLLCLLPACRCGFSSTYLFYARFLRFGFLLLTTFLLCAARDLSCCCRAGLRFGLYALHLFGLRFGIVFTTLPRTAHCAPRLLHHCHHLPAFATAQRLHWFYFCRHAYPPARLYLPLPAFTACRYRLPCLLHCLPHLHLFPRLLLHLPPAWDLGLPFAAADFFVQVRLPARSPLAATAVFPLPAPACPPPLLPPLLPATTAAYPACFACLPHFCCRLTLPFLVSCHLLPVLPCCPHSTTAACYSPHPALRSAWPHTWAAVGL